MEKIGKGNIKAKVIAHSQHSSNDIITFEIEVHRFVWAELMTHRTFSRNASSSRAIPVKKMIDHVRHNSAVPIKWVKNQSGMQSHTDHSEPVVFRGVEMTPTDAWLKGMEYATDLADAFNDSGYHKQHVNRITEPYQMIKAVITTTSLDNWFNLRFESFDNYSAQVEIHELARLMYELYQESEPVELDVFDWHTPYFDEGYFRTEVDSFTEELFDQFLENPLEQSGILNSDGVDLSDALKVSSSCSAQVSYRTLDTSIEKAVNVFGKLVLSTPVHASALEHCATPIIEIDYNSDSWMTGVTHMTKDYEFCSGNFKHFVQYRQLIPNHDCEHFTIK